MDAVGDALDTAALGETDVLVTIATDGAENSSTRWNKSKIKVLLGIRQRENKWGITYFGANQDAWAEAQKFGVMQANAVTYDSTNTSNMFKSMSAVRGAYVTSALNNTYDISNLTANVDRDSLKGGF